MAWGNTDPLRRRARWPRLLLFIAVAAGTAIAFRQGYVMPGLNPLPLIDMSHPNQWLIDLQPGGNKN